MTVHPQVQAILDIMAGLGLPPMETLTPPEARRQMEETVKARGTVEADIAGTEELVLPGPGGDIPARLYRPNRTTDDPLPVLVYYHGGGHVIGSPDTHDGVARLLCEGAEAAVLSVNYRKAPEHKFPAAAEDAYAAVEWAHGEGAALGLDPSRIAVGGDSAGGNLAAVVALMARDADGPELKLQILVYPVADYACVGDSYGKYASGYGPLSDKLMLWFQQHYLRGIEDAADWRASPIKAQSHAGLAPAVVITAECDVLHDEGVAYAEALSQAGVEVDHRDYPGMIHMFFGMPAAVDGAVAARQQAIDALRRAFA